MQWIGDYTQEVYGNAQAPKRKSWWTKRITNCADTACVENRLHFGGPPSVYDLKMLYEQGFDSVYSVLQTTQGGFADGLNEPTATVQAAAADIGLMYRVNPVTDWGSQAALDDYVAFIDFALAETDGPVYVHCGIGLASGTALQMYRLAKGMLPQTAAGITQAIDEIAIHGFDITGHVSKLALAANTSAPTSTPTVTAAAVLPNYPWAKYLGKLGTTEFYDAGQIHSAQVTKMASDGQIGAVVNMRKSPTVGGREITALLNIYSTGDGTSSDRANATYVSQVSPQWIIDSDRPNTYDDPESDNPADNFLSINHFEFGDEHGYSSDLEAAAWASVNISYTHLPVGGTCDACKSYTTQTMVDYADELIAAINVARAAGKHILFHCRTGYRTGAFPTLLLGLISGTSGADMGARMAALGYEAFATEGNAVNTLFTESGTLQFTGTVPADNTAPITGTVTFAPTGTPQASTASIAMPTVAVALLAAWLA